MKFTSAICFIAYQAATMTSAHAGPQPSGIYTIGTLAPVMIECQSERDCNGFYNENGKKSFLYLTSDQADGHFTGFWAEPKAKRTCDSRIFADIETDAWGRVEFWFDADAEGWTGLWYYCEDDAENTWNGSR